MDQQKSYFWLTQLCGVTIATSLSGGTRDFLNLRSICFLITKFQKFLKVKSDLIFETNTPKYL